MNMRLIDADALKAKIESVDADGTIANYCKKALANCLDSDAPTVEAIPVGWFYEFIRSAGMQGQIGVVQAFRYVLGTWKATREEWEAKQETRSRPWN